MIKKTLTIISSIVVLSACGTVAESKEDERFITKDTNNYELYTIEDSETGCKYLQFEGDREGGITPLLKSDGTPDCSKENE